MTPNPPPGPKAGEKPKRLTAAQENTLRLLPEEWYWAYGLLEPVSPDMRHLIDSGLVQVSDYFVRRTPAGTAALREAQGK